MIGKMRAAAVLLAALLAVTAVSGARVNIRNFNAPAPAPGADKIFADLQFTLTASKATFAAADRLVLEGVQSTAQAFNTETRATATYALGTFANATDGAPFASAWAGAPNALMYAMRDGSKVQALLQLSQPAFDAAANQLTFAVRLLPADGQQLKLAGGATARAADDAANGLASALLTSAPVGAELTAAALFIDEASAQMSPAATTKGWGYDRGYSSGWGNSWGGNSWGGDYQQPQQQQNNINNNNVVQNQGWQQSQTNINNNNVANNGDNGNTNINNNNVGNGQGGSNTNINNNNVG